MLPVRSSRRTMHGSSNRVQPAAGCRTARSSWMLTVGVGLPAWCSWDRHWQHQLVAAGMGMMQHPPARQMIVGTTSGRTMQQGESCDLRCAVLTVSLLSVAETKAGMSGRVVMRRWGCVQVGLTILPAGGPVFRSKLAPGCGSTLVLRFRGGCCYRRCSRHGSGRNPVFNGSICAAIDNACGGTPAAFRDRGGHHRSGWRRGFGTGGGAQRGIPDRGERARRFRSCRGLQQTFSSGQYTVCCP